jgi:hypothetical protein
MLLYNRPSAFKRVGLPEELHDARPKRLRFLILNTVGKVVRHARETLLRCANAVARALADVPRVAFRLARPAIAGASLLSRRIRVARSWAVIQNFVSRRYGSILRTKSRHSSPLGCSPGRQMAGPAKRSPRQIHRTVAGRLPCHNAGSTAWPAPVFDAIADPQHAHHIGWRMVVGIERGH